MKERKLLALDPSSTRTGYAVMRAGTLIESGLITPAKKSAPPEMRIASMMPDLHDLLAGYMPDYVVVELPSGHTHGRLKGRPLRGRAAYGMAVGGFLEHIRAFQQEHGTVSLVTVSANDWTKGVPKAKRAKNIALKYPAYDAGQDAGGDIADAIGLIEWFRARLLLGAKVKAALG